MSRYHENLVTEVTSFEAYTGDAANMLSLQPRKAVGSFLMIFLLFFFFPSRVNLVNKLSRQPAVVAAAPFFFFLLLFSSSNWFLSSRSHQ